MGDLLLRIRFNVLEDRFKVESNIKKEQWGGIVENVVSSHIGEGVDNSKATERDVYLIDIDYSMDDTFTVSSDTGNKGLTTGILARFLVDCRAGKID